MRNLTVILLVFLALPLVTTAAIYRFYDENGNVVFADQPGPGAEEIEKKDIQTIKTNKARPTTKLKNTDQDKTKFSYTEFRISKPENDATIRDNNGDVNVDITIKPQLRTKLKHKIVLLLDGKPVSEPGTATAFALHNIDRGQHTLSAKVIDKEGKTIISVDSVTIHLKRFSILQPRPANTLPPPSQTTPAATK